MHCACADAPLSTAADSREPAAVDAGLSGSAVGRLCSKDELDEVPDYVPSLRALSLSAVSAHVRMAAASRWRSTWLGWSALIAIDLVSRASYLTPRLITARGFVNYSAACMALWIVIRLLQVVTHRPRVILVALLVALPMAVEWAVFGSYGQFVAPTDFVAFFESPRVVFQAAGEGGDRFGSLAVFCLATASAWLVPPEAKPLRWWRASVASLALATTIGVGASYWRASPSLEHSQPAFACALAGVMKRATVHAKGSGRATVPSAPALPQNAERLPNIVLVLGESLAASHLTLYGYDKPTTPHLQELFDRKELLAFRDAVVMGPHTRTSVPYIMTGLAGPDPGGRVFRAPTVTQYAKARGYHTAFVSAQEESWGDLDAMLREGTDEFHSGLEFAPHVDVLKGADDLVVLERGVLPAIRSLAEPFFLVVHMDGSHLPYSDHSPASHKIFPEDGVNGANAYDNTIRVTDEYVARVFETLRARDPNAWLFFTSDHGQPLGEGGAFFNRGYQSNVVRDPLLAFPPQSSDHARWTEIADSQVSACDLTPTILHLMQTAPPSDAPMDCTDWLARRPAPRYRVVSAYTPAYVAEPTMLVLEPGGKQALYDLWRSTVTLDDGVPRPMTEHLFPPEIGSRLSH
jgi:glucan phosphoethanolaminetransferase (alkaline phosphatase superfamily)